MTKYVVLCIYLLSYTSLNAQYSGVTAYKIGNLGNTLPGNMCKTINHLYFSADDGIHGLEPWFTDGTKPPALFVDLHPTLDGIHPQYHKMLTAQGDLFFVYANHVAVNWPKGTQLYDISSKNIYPLTPGNYTHEVLGVYNDTLILAFVNNNAFTIAKLNVNINLSLDTICKINQHWPKEIKQCANRLYYAAYAQSGQYVDLFCINMNSKTPATVITGLPRSANDYYNNMVGLGNYMYFIGHTAQFGNELYRHDGNTLERLTDLILGSISGVIPNHNVVHPYNGKIYFSGYDSAMKAGLFCFDPATKKIAKIHNPWTNKTYNPSQFIEYHGKLFFQCLDTTFGAELYAYDGINPPYMAADVTPGKAGCWPQNMIVFKDDLFFSGTDSSGNPMLFKYNDSALTTPVFPPNSAASANQQLSLTLYPNPTTGNTYLDIQIKEAHSLSLQVLDISGRIVYTLDSKLYSQGKHTINLPMDNMPAGTYLYRVAGKNNGWLYSGELIKQ